MDVHRFSKAITQSFADASQKRRSRAMCAPMEANLIHSAMKIFRLVRRLSSLPHLQRLRRIVRLNCYHTPNGPTFRLFAGAQALLCLAQFVPTDLQSETRQKQLEWWTLAKVTTSSCIPLPTTVLNVPAKARVACNSTVNAPVLVRERHAQFVLEVHSVVSLVIPHFSIIAKMLTTKLSSCPLTLATTTPTPTTSGRVVVPMQFRPVICVKMVAK
jgi:hypothetical protein